MSIKLLVDMNLSPQWVDVFERNGWSATHWSVVGDPTAPDRTLMDWARDEGYVVFTHDLDFGMALALTKAEAPSVLQMRAQDVLPQNIGHLVITLLSQYEDVLSVGALVVADERSHRVRVLPLNS